MRAIDRVDTETTSHYSALGFRQLLERRTEAIVEEIDLCHCESSRIWEPRVIHADLPQHFPIHDEQRMLRLTGFLIARMPPVVPVPDQRGDGLYSPPMYRLTIAWQTHRSHHNMFA